MHLIVPDLQRLMHEYCKQMGITVPHHVVRNCLQSDAYEGYDGYEKPPDHELEDAMRTRPLPRACATARAPRCLASRLGSQCLSTALGR